MGHLTHALRLKLALVAWRQCLRLRRRRRRGGAGSQAYAKVTGTIAPSKPMVIGEIAASESAGSKALWIEEMFEALALRYPKIDASGASSSPIPAP